MPFRPGHQVLSRSQRYNSFMTQQASELLQKALSLSEEERAELAGSLIESVKNLDCTVDPNEIRQKAGGGADCMFDTGP